MKTYRCDKCKKQYGDIEDSNLITLCGSQKYCLKDGEFDLCDKCYEELLNWIKPKIHCIDCKFYVEEHEGYKGVCLKKKTYGILPYEHSCEEGELEEEE